MLDYKLSIDYINVQFKGKFKKKKTEENTTNFTRKTLIEMNHQRVTIFKAKK